MKSFVRLIVLVVVIVGGIVVVAPIAVKFLNALPNFETFTSDAGNFSVSMRGKPAESSEEIPLANGGKSTRHTFQSLPPGQAYIVIYEDYPDAAIKAYPDVSAILADRLKGFIGSGAILVSTKDVDLGTIPGIQVMLTAAGDSGNIKIQAQIYVSGNRIYVVQFNGKADDFPQADADQFAASFTIKP